MRRLFIVLIPLVFLWTAQVLADPEAGPPATQLAADGPALQQTSQPTAALTSKEAGRDAAAAKAKQKKAPAWEGRGFGAGVTLGYGYTLEIPAGIELKPQALSVGLQLEYVFSSGLRLAVHGDYGFGKDVPQTYRPVGYEPIELTAKSKMLNMGLSFGFDDDFGPVVLRYALDIGMSLLSWDLGPLPWVGLGGYAPPKGSTTSLYLAPGLGLLFPFSRFYAGVEARYQVQLGDVIPSGVLVFLHTGVRW
jgi:hypothetical protein